MFMLGKQAEMEMIHLPRLPALTSRRGACGVHAGRLSAFIKFFFARRAFGWQPPVDFPSTLCRFDQPAQTPSIIGCLHSAALHLKSCQISN